jgi:hypothetical protein
MAVLYEVSEQDIARGLRERGLAVESFDDLTRDERELAREYIHLVFDTARRELLDMLAQVMRRGRGLPE